MEIYHLVPKPEYGHWSKLCDECAWAVAKFAVGKHGLKNSNTNRGRLSYLTARALMRAARSVATKEGGDAHKRVYAFFGEEMGMKSLRAFVEPVVHDIIARMIWPPASCPDCTRNKKLGQTCDLCGQVQCALHCACTRDDGTLEAVVRWRKRLEEFVYRLPEVETIETPEDAPLTTGTFVLHTYDDDHPHFEVVVKAWRPDEEEENDGE
jgi:hypothetical protein